MSGAVPRGVAAALVLSAGLGWPAAAGPIAHREVLPNGIRLLVAERPALPVVVVQVSVPAGSAQDPAEASGLANLTAEVLTRGTTRWTGPEVDRAIEFVGGSLDATASRDTATVSISRPQEGPRSGARPPRRGPAPADVPGGRAAAEGGRDPGCDHAVGGEPGGRGQPRAGAPGLPGPPVRATGRGHGGVRGQARPGPGARLLPASLPSGPRDRRGRGRRERRGGPRGRGPPARLVGASARGCRVRAADAEPGAPGRGDDRTRPHPGHDFPRAAFHPADPPRLLSAHRGELRAGRRLVVAPLREGA